MALNFDLKSLSSGHAGLSTVRSRTPIDALERLVELAREANSDARYDDIRQVLSMYELAGLENGRFLGHTLCEADIEGEPVMHNVPGCVAFLAARDIHYSPP